MINISNLLEYYDSLEGITLMPNEVIVSEDNGKTLFITKKEHLVNLIPFGYEIIEPA